MEKYNLIKDLRKEYKKSFMLADFNEIRKSHEEIKEKADRYSIIFDCVLLYDEAFDIMSIDFVLKEYIRGK